jgi:Amt family ammonium transporter
LAGYSLAFTGSRSWVGGGEYFLLLNIAQESHPENIEFYTKIIFQMMFASIAPAIIVGAIVGKIRFNAYLVFIILWSLIVYSTIAHWIWAESGWLKKLGVIDFAGGMVVHLSAGCSALTAAIMLGASKYHCRSNKMQHIPFVLLGASILWFGWFGFNAGSSGGFNELSAVAFFNTVLAPSVAIVVWLVLSGICKKKVSIVGVSSASIVGLVAITPACGFVNHISALYIGGGASIICFFCIYKKDDIMMGVNDTLDVFISHGIAAIVGSILTGIFCSQSINPNIENGVLFGGYNVLYAQIVGVIVVGVFSMLMTYFILKTINIFIEIRIPSDLDHLGLDEVEHEEQLH